MTRNCTILGIDPGTNLLGFGIVRVKETGGPEFVDAGILDLRKEKDPYAKLAQIKTFVTRVIETYSPQCLAIESPFLGKNAQVIFKLGRAQGVALAVASEMGLEICEYAPRKAKISVCGNGNASKEQVSLMVQKILGIKIEDYPLDSTDALAIALCHYYQIISPLAQTRDSSSWEKFIAAHPDRIK